MSLAIILLTAGVAVTVVSLIVGFLTGHGLALFTFLVGVLLAGGGLMQFYSHGIGKAVEVIAENHGVTITERGTYTTRPSDWMIDGIWRECYLTTDDPDKAISADLMCEAPIDGRAPYTKVEPTD
jgi:hypothetical protein